MKTTNFPKGAVHWLTVICTILISVTTIAQKSVNLDISWKSPRAELVDGEMMMIPQIEGQGMSLTDPRFMWREPLGTPGNPSLSMVITGTAPALSQEVSFLNKRKIEVSNEPVYELRIVQANTERSAKLSLMPFIKVGGAIQRITSVQVNYSKGTPTPPVFIQKDFVANSALAPGSGVWCKVSITQDGIYKLDKAFLASCFASQGIDINSINPQHINIFGNGDGRLPEANWVPRTDDLAKNAIQIVGEADGSFDDNDYILFYGWGPHRLYSNGTADLRLDRNPYTDVAAYFININSNDVPRRMEFGQQSTSAVTHNVQNYSYYTIYEEDKVNLVKAGQRWYGDLFDNELVRTYTLSVPNITAGSTVNFKSAYASNPSGGTNKIIFKVGGNNLDTAVLVGSSTEFGRGVSGFPGYGLGGSIPLTVEVIRANPNVRTYLDFIELNARRDLTMLGNQFNFRDLGSVGVGNVTEYTVSNINSTYGFVWEVTDRHAPKRIAVDVSSGQATFRMDADSLREYVGSNGIGFLTPTIVGAVQYQNLHGLGQADYLMVTHPKFLQGANRLADLHRSNGLTVHVVTQDQIFNEYSSGVQDATAIRMFAKMFYDRGAANPDTRPKYLCLFGDGSFDFKKKEYKGDFLMTYQVPNSEHSIQSLVSDDYFGFLDDSDVMNAMNELDIGIGRILVSSPEIATQQVNKIEHYMRNGSSLYSSATTNCNSNGIAGTYGDWRTSYVQVADDVDKSIDSQFITFDCEPAYDSISANVPGINVDKIYMDAFPQLVTAGGERYPDVVNLINDRMERGALVTNYVGHGGEVGAAEERVITIPQIQNWKNIDKLTLMVSATCEFTKYDDPSRVSAGEWVALNPYGGAIALMTTTRSVYFDVNSATIDAFVNNVFRRSVLGEPMTFGEIIRRTKNETNSGSNNKRSFTLIGDPGLQIALPRMRVVTDSVNGISPTIELDTISALGKVTIKGHLEDHLGNVMNNFNGVIYPTIFDKPKEYKTLANDPAASEYDFELQTNRLFRGKASVNNGHFEFTFVVPKDISYSYGAGKLSYYAHNETTDALGGDKRIIVGGIDPVGVNDSEGPQIDLFLNDENFVNGGITDETPILIAKLFDENGINTVGNGVGHDLIAILDGKSGDPIVLNNYYTGELDDYQSGEIRYRFPDLEEGPHTLKLKVWDVNNNSSEATIEFVVHQKEDLSLDHVLNYPNPFTTRTEFFFEHNQACTDLDAMVQIFTVSGRLVKTIQESVQCDGFRSKGIVWDGRDDFGDQLAKGVYVYQLSVRAPDGAVADKTEKLVLLK